MSSTLRSRTLHRAAELLGSKAKLRELLRVPMNTLEAWLGGVASTPLDVFLRAVDIVSAPIPRNETMIVLEAALDAALRATNADMGNVQRLDPDGLRIVAQRGFDQPFLEFFALVDGAESACGAALKESRRIVVVDVASDPLFAGTEVGEAMERARARAVQSTPLVGSSGRLVGMLSTHFDRPWVPSARELASLDLIAERAARALEVQTP